MTKEEILQRITFDMVTVEQHEFDVIGKVNPITEDFFDTLLRVVKKAPEGWFECPCEDCRKECDE